MAWLRRPVRIRWWIFAYLFAFAMLSYIQRTSIGIAAERMEPELHLSQMQIGWIMEAFTVMYAVMQAPAGIFGQRFGARTTLVTSTVLMTFAYAFRMTFDDTVVLIIVGSVLGSIGNAVAFATMPTLIMSSVPLSETAAANGVNGLLRTIGSSGMSAVVAALLTAITIDAEGQTLPGRGAFVATFAVAASQSRFAGSTSRWFGFSSSGPAVARAAVASPSGEILPTGSRTRRIAAATVQTSASRRDDGDTARV